MPSSLAQAIRAARRACGLTQEQLGRRLGLKGRAIYRWERDDSAPRKRRRRELITAIGAVNQAAAAALAAAIASEAPAGAAVPAPAALAPPPVDPQVVFERAVFGLADELDVPARRARAAVIRLVKQMRQVGIALETAERYLEQWNESAAK